MMTKLLLKSLYRRMLPMELRKFFFNWVLLRNTFCAVMREALAFEQRCTYLTDMRPLRVCPHSRGGGAALHAGPTFTPLLGLFSGAVSVGRTLLCTRKVMVVGKTAVHFCPQISRLVGQFINPAEEMPRFYSEEGRDGKVWELRV